MRHPTLTDCLYLVGCGVPYDVAFGLDDDERMAYIIIFGSLSGFHFDWRTMKWRELM
jgi:hypothetical protein